MANYISSKLLFLSVTLIGIMYQVYVVDGLDCVVCLPKESETGVVAQSLRNEIRSLYPNTQIPICTDNLQFKAAILVDQSYWKACSKSSPWCFKQDAGNWTGRTCRGGNYKQGCETLITNANLKDCYCNNKNKCNSATGLHSTIINVIYAVISAFALNKFM